MDVTFQKVVTTDVKIVSSICLYKVFLVFETHVFVDYDSKVCNLNFFQVLNFVVVFYEVNVSPTSF